MTVTIFVPIMETLYDPEYGPHLYEGKLNREKVLEIGRELGGLDDQGYAAIAIEGNDKDGWYLTYNNEEREPTKHEDGATFQEIEGCGSLAYSVEYRELN